MAGPEKYTSIEGVMSVVVSREIHCHRSTERPAAPVFRIAVNKMKGGDTGRFDHLRGTRAWADCVLGFDMCPIEPEEGTELGAAAGSCLVECPEPGGCERPAMAHSGR